MSLQERERVANLQAFTYVSAIANRVSDSIELANFSLLGFVNAVKLLPSNKLNPSTYAKLLSSKGTPSSDTFWMLFIDADGVAVATSGDIPIKGVSYADRMYFQVHKHEIVPGDSLYISAPLAGKKAGKLASVVSRRVVSADGKFLGVVAAPMRPARFYTMFDAARLDQGTSIALVYQSGEIIASNSVDENIFPAKKTMLSFFGASRRERSQVFQETHDAHGRLIISSFRAVENKPLAVYVGISLAPSLETFKSDIAVVGSVILIMVLVMFLSAQYTCRAYWQLHLSKMALEDSQFRWKFALEGAGDGVWDWNVVTDEVYFSPNWRHMLGYAEAEPELESHSGMWLSLMHPDDRAMTLAAMKLCLKGKVPDYVSQFRLKCRDGSWKWILGRGTVVMRNDAGLALRMIGTHTDITNQKKAEQAQVHKIVDAASDPLLLVDNDGVIIFANGSANATFGYALDELNGRHINTLVKFGPTSNYVSVRNEFDFIRELTPLNSQKTLTAVHNLGYLFSIEVSFSPFTMDGQSVVIISMRDITERNQATELLQHSFLRLRQFADHEHEIKEAERKRIAQDIHDDLGQNLLVLKMDVASLYTRTSVAHPRLHARAAMVLKNIDATIKSMKAIMNDLRPAALEFGLFPAVRWQVAQFERISGISCTVTSNVPDATLGLDEASTMGVFRILQESLSNVAHHAQASVVEILLIQDERGFTMQITDDGKGFQPGDKEKENSFGLMGIKERIRALGGEITITSKVGHGTVLVVFLAEVMKNLIVD